MTSLALFLGCADRFYPILVNLDIVSINLDLLLVLDTVEWFILFVRQIACSIVAR